MLVRQFGLALLLCSIFLLETEASTKYKRYLEHFFQKYGSGGSMTFEGLEHLLASLGLGEIKFDPTHTIEEHRPKGFNITTTENNSTQDKSYFEQHAQTFDSVGDIELFIRKGDDVILEFLELHDPKHRHPRENAINIEAAPQLSSVCLSPKSLLSLVVDHDDLHKDKFYKQMVAVNADAHNSAEEYSEFINHIIITPVAFMKLCPAILSQIDNNVCMRSAPLMLTKEDKRSRIWDAWIYASISIFILSVCGLLGILLVPLMKSVAYQEILKFLVAIAVGTLSGDALMHLLPHALAREKTYLEIIKMRSSAEASERKHDNEAVYLCACAFAAALLMYVIENLIPLLKGDNGEGESETYSSHGHSHHGKPVENRTAIPTATPPPLAIAESKEPRELNVMLHETQVDQKSPHQSLTPVAFMVVIGDGLHNLTDGLAIGAAFGSDPVTGLATAFAVLCHELPHELGDFALLLQSGVSIRRAVYLNIVSSVLSFVGMAFGLLIAGVHEDMTPWIYAATAGSFLYIAFADLIPTMSVSHAAEIAHDVKSKILQIFGITVGGFIMLMIAVNEHDLEEIFKSL